MSEEFSDNAAKVLRGAGRHWGWPMAYGVITLLLGVVVLIWPGRTVEVVAILLGIQPIRLGHCRRRRGRRHAGVAGVVGRAVVHRRLVRPA
jgi:hypothetical protein